MSMLKKQNNLDTNAVSVSSSDINDKKEIGSQESFYCHLKTFCLKWGGWLGVGVAAACYNLYFPLSAKAAGTSPTHSISLSIQALAKDQKEDTIASSSKIRSSRRPLPRTQTKLQPVLSPSPPLSDSRNLSGTQVRRFPTTYKSFGNFSCFNLNKEKEATNENQVALQGDVIVVGKTAIEILEKMNEKNVTLIKNFLAMNQNRVTDKNLIPLVWETAAKLTDSTLNTRQELEILYPVMKSRLNYLGVENSEFSKERKYDLLAQEIECIRFLLTSDFHNYDSLVNRTSHGLKLYSGPFNQLPAKVNNEMSAQALWPINWRNEWRNTFRKIKLVTADQLEDLAEDGLGKNFQEENGDLYSITANVCSIAPLYLVDKTAQAFQLFSNAHHGDVDGVSSLQDLQAKVNALIEDQDLDAYFDKNHEAFYKALSPEDSSSLNDSPTLFQKIRKKRVGQRKYYNKKKQKGLLYPELEFVRAQNNQLFELFVSDDLFI